MNAFLNSLSGCFSQGRKTLWEGTLNFKLELGRKGGWNARESVSNVDLASLRGGGGDYKTF